MNCSASAHSKQSSIAAEDRLDARLGTSTQNTPYALLMVTNKPLPTCYIITDFHMGHPNANQPFIILSQWLLFAKCCLEPSSHLHYLPQVSPQCWPWPPWAQWPGTRYRECPTWRPWTCLSPSASCSSSLPWLSMPCSTTTPTVYADLLPRHGEW